MGVETNNNSIYKVLPQIQKELKVPKNLKNNFGNYTYRNVETIYEAIKPLLLMFECSLSINDEVVAVGDRIYIKATATIIDKYGASHSVSAYAREALNKKGMDDAQITGSASSYARKYALGGLFLLDDNKDIDSQDNTQNNTNAEKKDPVKVIMSELTKIGMSMADIKNFMAASNYSSKDVAVMDYLANNIDKLKIEAEGFMQNAVSNGIRN